MSPVPSEEIVHTISDLRTRAAPPPACTPLSCGVAVLCHDTDGDGGGGYFVWVAGAATADNGGTVMRSTVAGAPQGAWKRVYSGPIDVRWFGAKGDGIADDYSAIQAAVGAVNAAGGGSLVFPPGNYLIARQVVESPSNGITHIVFRRCKGLHILGYGATITVSTANFSRTTSSDTVVPVYLLDCERVLVEGLELVGGVGPATPAKAAGSGDGNSMGILTDGCRDVVLRNLYVHNFMTDGLYLGAGSAHVACQGVVLENVRASYNTRNNCSVIQVRGGTFVDCAFEEGGNNGGVAYPGAEPQAGMDVEPNYWVGSATPMDVNTGDLLLLRCRFYGNRGSQFSAGQGAQIENVTLRDCALDDNESAYPYSVIMAVNNGAMMGCYMKGMGVYASWVASDPLPPIRTVIKDCTMVTRCTGIYSYVNDGTTQEVIIDACEIRGSHTVPLTEPIVYIRNTACTFVNNKIFLPTAAHAGATYMVAVLIQDVRLSRNNQFDTDLVPKENEHFCTAYASTMGAITIDDDLYVPHGPSPSFRPEPNATWDNAYPYSGGKTSCGAIPMGSAVMNPGPMGAGAVWQSPWVAVNGASVNDPVLVGAPPAIEAGLLWSAYVSSAGLITLRLFNQSGGPITPAPATWKFTVFH